MNARVDQRLVVPFEFPVIFTDYVFSPDNAALHSALNRLGETRPPRAMLYVDAGAEAGTPGLAAAAAAWCRHWNVSLAAPARIIPGGEPAKNDWAATQALVVEMLDLRLDRHAFVIIAGGGALLDAVGFAASLVHRGLRVIRVPTTALAQCDGAVGVKTAVNFAGGKNAIGTFAPPFAVLNDFQFLPTLSEREWRGGIAEAFKVAIIRDRPFFDFLCENTAAFRERRHGPMRHLVQRCAELHLEHIRTGGDPFEMGRARPLDFGHWSAHKLELLSNFRIGHGDAVAAGVALDSAYAALQGWIRDEDFQRIHRFLYQSGFPLWYPEMEDPALLEGLREFQEHLGGDLCITFPNGLGRSRQESQIDAAAIRASLERLRQMGAAENPKSEIRKIWRAKRAIDISFPLSDFEFPPMPLTYCLNIHPGETWSENFSTLRTTVLAVRDLVSPGTANLPIGIPPPLQPFGLGLRLSAAAAATLDDAETLAELTRFLTSEKLYVFTINGFPFGRFHGGPVKENVYAPDWRSAERRDYTNQLASILAALVPEGGTGSISTVPCSWKPWIQSPTDLDLILDHLTDCVAHCAAIADREGRDVLLALEPEPGCLLETTSETVEFFNTRLFARGAALLAAKLHSTEPAALALIRHHLGVCLDTCHAALQFEDPADSLRRFQSEGIRVPKIQISSALRTGAGPAALDALRPFAEPVYLHQVKARTPAGEILGWTDLPQALAELPATRAEEVRVHFHVPLHFTDSGPLSSTASLLTSEFLADISRDPLTHLEIETYTWDVLPESLRQTSIEQSIAAEFHWLEHRMPA